MVVSGLSRFLVPMGRQIVQDDNGRWGWDRNPTFSTL